LTKAIAATIADSPITALSFHHRVHSDQRVLLNDAPMQHRAMPDVTALVDQRIVPRKRVQHTGVLDIGARTDVEAAEVAAQRCRRADVTVGTDNHVADQHGAWMHVCRWIHHWRHAIDRIDS
jgi:hypothetical protein